MQADTALDSTVQKEYQFMEFDGPANVLVCPNLAAANIAYKLVENLADAELTADSRRNGKTSSISSKAKRVRHIVNMATPCCRVHSKRVLLATNFKRSRELITL